MQSVNKLHGDQITPPSSPIGTFALPQNVRGIKTAPDMSSRSGLLITLTGKHGHTKKCITILWYEYRLVVACSWSAMSTLAELDIVPISDPFALSQHQPPPFGCQR